MGNQKPGFYENTGECPLTRQIDCGLEGQEFPG